MLILVLLALALAWYPPPLPADASAVCTNGSARYTAGSAYETSLRRVAATLPANASSSPALFAVAAVVPAAGSSNNNNSNQTVVYALGHCRGDLGAASCAACLRAGFKEARALCPNDADASAYFDNCHMRFSDLDFLASTNNSEQHAYFSSSSVAAVHSSSSSSSVAAGQFYALLTQLLGATAECAAAASSPLRFATGEMDVADDDSSSGGGGRRQQIIASVFSMAQCTPDLTPPQCRACLAGALAEMSRRVLATNSTAAASLYGERCGLRFAPFRFYGGDAMVHLHMPPPQAQGKTTVMTLVLAIVLPILGGLLALALIGFFGLMNKRSQRKAPIFINIDDMVSLESIFIDLSTLRSATSNFDEKNKLGEGGFGVVYKGALPDGQEVAVKRLSESTKRLSQMKNELALLVKLQHKNLVRIIGICMEKEENLLVYKYMPNKSLDAIIFDPNKSGQLDWGTRFKIINGIAQGLQYAHEHSQMKIVHGDLKASNILLNADMKPKISDCGLAKIFEDDQTRRATSHIIGTLGYMSSEYAIRGQYSTKLDVFSFGVLVLEIVTGRRNNYALKSEDSPDLLCLVWKHWVEGTIAQIADPNLGRNYPMAEVLKCVNIGLLCVQQNPTDRPSMSAIIVMLDSDTVAVEAPYRPAYVNRSKSYLESTTKLVMEKEELCSEPHSCITELVSR